MCVCERERERERVRQTDRPTDRERERERGQWIRFCLIDVCGEIMSVFTVTIAGPVRFIFFHFSAMQIDRVSCDKCPLLTHVIRGSD